MLINGLVKWSQWNESGRIAGGQMRVPEAMEKIREFGAKAAELQKETDADHVVYGRKIYDKDGELDEIRFYLTPMPEDEFNLLALLPNQMVYAIHK